MPHRPSRLRPAVLASSGAGGGGAGASSAAGELPGWELASRVSADALELGAQGDVVSAELVLMRGLSCRHALSMMQTRLKLVVPHHLIVPLLTPPPPHRLPPPAAACRSVSGGP